MFSKYSGILGLAGKWPSFMYLWNWELYEPESRAGFQGSSEHSRYILLHGAPLKSVILWDGSFSPSGASSVEADWVNLGNNCIQEELWNWGDRQGEKVTVRFQRVRLLSAMENLRKERYYLHPGSRALKHQQYFKQNPQSSFNRSFSSV